MVECVSRYLFAERRELLHLQINEGGSETGWEHMSWCMEPHTARGVGTK